MAQVIDRPPAFQETVPSNGKAAEGADLDVAANFRLIADEWSRQTAVLSSVNEIVAHPAYRQVIEMGPAVVPLILRELQKRPAHWFAALREITGENPVPAEDAGRMSRMRDHWVEWGRQRGLV